jgi:hypothetical protein
MNDQLLSVQDVAVLTGWSPFTIYKKSARKRSEFFPIVIRPGISPPADFL